MPVVIMPDGAHVAFPDNMPADQIRSMILQKFPNAASQAGQTAQSQSAPQDNGPGILSDIGSGVANAVEGAAKNVADYLNPFSATRHAEYAKMAQESPMQVTGDLIKQTAGVGQALATPVTAPGNVAAAVVTPPLAKGWQAVNSAVGIDLPDQQAKDQVSLALMGLAPKGASPMAVKGTPILPRAELPSPSDLKTAYTNTKDALAPSKVQPFQIGQVATQADNLLSKFRPSQVGDLRDLVTEMKDASSGRLPTGQLAPRPTFGLLDDWRSQLGDMANETKQTMSGPQPTPQAAAAKKVKGLLDTLMENVGPGWKDANANYSAAKVAEGLDKRAVKAQVRADAGNGDFAQRMKTNAAQILTNDKLSRGMTSDELSRLKTIAGGTATQNTLDWFGKLLGSKFGHYGIGPVLGYAAGGPVGAAAGIVGDDLAARGMMGIRNALANRQARALVESVLRRSPLAQQLLAQGGQAQIPVSAPPLLSLTMPRLPALLSNPLAAIPAYAGNQQHNR